jgi:membrane protein YdbS with pleckstrin-like domain
MFVTLMMPFINAEVDVAQLPAAECIPLTPIHHSYLKVLRTERIVNTVVLSAIALSLIFFIPSIQQSYWWVIIAIALILITIPYHVLQEKSFPFFAYAIREHDVVFQKGWLVRTLKVCPFNRIQNCSMQAGILERKYGLASLTLYTAGTEGADIRIPGLKQEEAEQIRQFILNRINAAH